MSAPELAAAAAATTLPPGVQADGWFREENAQWPGQALSLRCDAVLHDAQTEFQRLTVFSQRPESGPWGTVMTLDGCVQLTDRDEFVYHEMMAHVPLFAHRGGDAVAGPRDVLIIGGGDGGVLREVLRHASVQRCTLVDIDGAVIEASKRFFPRVAVAFADPRATAIVGDGVAFVRSAAAASFDVVVVDSSDPDGPASALFGAEFYADVRRVLRPGGIVCSQGESIWLNLPLIEKMQAFFRAPEVGFSAVSYGMIYIPTYPCGSIGCLLARNGGGDATPFDFATPRGAPDEAMGSALRYYDEAVHRAAFVLPKFARHLNGCK